MFDQDEEDWFDEDGHDPAGMSPARVAVLSRDEYLARAQREGATHGITVSMVTSHYDALASVRTCPQCGQRVEVRGPAAAWELKGVAARLYMSHQPATCETVRRERAVHVQWGLNYNEYNEVVRQDDEHEARGVAAEYARIPDEPNARGHSRPTAVYRLAGAWKTAPDLPPGAVGEQLAAAVERLRAAVEDGDQTPISHADVRAVLEALTSS